MNSFRAFVLCLAVAFALPWFFLIVVPFQATADLDAVEFEVDGEKRVYPPGRVGAEHGAEVYARNGCAYCHTQMVRPTYAGADMHRTGWAGRGGEDSELRSTRPQDYLGEKFAYLGVQRHGPDLSNVGWRLPDRRWHYQHLYDPGALNPTSIMPSFRNLFEKRRVIGQVSDEAVEVWEKDGETWEAVPTNNAKALVDYLLALKKDFEVPENLATAN